MAGKILLSATNRETDPARKKARLADATATLARFSAAGARTYDNPAWVRFLLLDNQGNIREALRPFFPTPPGVAPTLANTTHAQMIVRLDGNQTTEQEGKASVAVAKAVRAVHFDGFSTLTTGAPALLKRINDYLMGGMLVLGGIAMVVMVVVLFAVFRVRWRLVPLAVMVLGVIWTFGLLGYAGFRLSIVTIAGLPILIGLGVEFAIQVQNRIEEEIVARSKPSPYASTLSHIGPALLVATVAAVVACLALQGVAHADDPRLRRAAGGRDRARVPRCPRRADRAAVHPRATVAHDRGTAPTRGRGGDDQARPSSAVDRSRW